MAGPGGGEAEGQCTWGLDDSDVMMKVFQFLSLGDLLRASQVCKQWCEVSEVIFESTCRKNGWRQPRLARGGAAVHRVFPWRGLYVAHACRNCGKKGEFIVRKSTLVSLRARDPAEKNWFLLCGICTRKRAIVNRLAGMDMSVDLIGVTGKKLVPKSKHKQERKRR